MAQYCSPMIAVGSGNTLGYVEEVCYGKIPVAPVVKTVRRRSTSLGMTKETYDSEEVRNDRMVSSSRHGVKAVAGDIVTEISPGGHADFYEALLGGNWEHATAPVSLNTRPFTVSADGVINFTTIAIDPSIGKNQIGDVVLMTGSAAPYFHNHLFQIVGLTASTMAVIPLLKPTVAPPASPVAVLSAQSQPRVDMGNIYRSFVMERAFDDIGSFIDYTGCRINSAAIDLPPSGIATATFGVMGQNAQPLSAVSIDGSSNLVTSDSVHGILNFDAATKTITGTTGDFAAGGFVAGDQIIIDSASGGLTRALRTIVDVTALVMTTAEALPTGATTGAWTITRLGASAYDEAAGNNVLVAATGVVVLRGVPVATVTALSISVDNQMASAPVVGSDMVPAILWGNNCKVSGSLTVLFDRGGAGEAAYNAFVSETDNLQLMASMVSADGTQAVSFVMNRCKFNSGDIGDAVAEGLPVTVEYVALKPIANQAFVGESQIVIVDTTVAGAIAPFAAMLPTSAPSAKAKVPAEVAA